MIIRAPVRIDFAGGWTDVPPYSTRHGDAVVNAAVALYVLVDVHKRAAGIHLSSADLGQSLQVESTRELVYDGRVDLIKAALRRSGLGEGWGGQHSQYGAGRQRPRCFRRPWRGPGDSGPCGRRCAAEARVGGGDRPPAGDRGAEGGRRQTGSALGGFTLLEFRDPEVRATRLRLEPRFLRELESRLVLCHTGTSRISGDMIARVMRGFESGDRKIVEALDGMHDAAIAARDALAAADINALAEVVEANWRNQQALDAGQTTAAIERIEAAAKAAGAIGSKACGAGAGGCMLFLVGPDAADGVKAAVQAAGGTLLPVSFDFEGVRSAPAIAV